jgi:ribosomal protein S18 acetylase RimI-like enzyme
VQLIYRHAVPNDLEKITELVRIAVIQMDWQGINQWDEIYPAGEDFKRDIAKNHLYVGQIDDEIAVVFCLSQEYDKEYENGMWKKPEKPFYVLHRLCVDPRVQNKGAARQTIKYIENIVAQNGGQAVRLDVFSQNPYAVRLYQRCGYQKVGTAEWRKGTFYLMEKYL